MRKLHRVVVGLAALGALAAGAAAQQGAGSAELGKKVMLAKCATCHGKDGRGVASMAKLFKVEKVNMDWMSAQNVAKSDAQLKATISNGNGKMPSFKTKLQAAEIADVVAYIRTLQKPEAK